MYRKSFIAVTAAAVLVTGAVAKQKLDNVVVTAKSNQSAENVAGSISIITSEEIKQMNATSIQEILEEVVGINVGVNDSSIAGRQTISIRGTDSKHALILIDGKKISGTDAQIGHSDFQYSWLPISAIEKIEIVRGPMSALYGSKAIGGVVNVITKQPDSELGGAIDFKKGASASNGGDEQEISLSFSGKATDKLSIAAAFEKKDIDITYKKGNENTTADREGKEISNRMLSAWYDIDNTQQIRAMILDGDETRQHQEYSTRSRRLIKYDNYYDIEKRHYSIGYQKSFDKVLMDLKYYNTSSDSHTQKYSYTHELEDRVLSAEFKVDAIENNFIVAGVERTTAKYRKHYDDVAKDITSGFKDEIDNTSVFIQDEIELGDSTLLVVGGRYDDHEKFGGQFSPKANIVYKFSENHRLKAGYGEGFNAPTLTQNSSKYQFSGQHIFNGNDALQPEESKSYELGYEFNNKNTTLKTTVFKTDVENLIEGLVIGSMSRPPFGKIHLYSNIDNVSMQGVEFDFKQKINSNFDISFNYNYLKTEDESTGAELIAKPKQKANLKVNAKLPYDVNTTLRVKYTGSQIAWHSNGTSTSSDDYKYTQNAYTTIGIQFSKELLQGLTGRIGVENLTNKQMHEEATYQLKGRVFYLGLNYSF